MLKQFRDEATVIHEGRKVDAKEIFSPLDRERKISERSLRFITKKLYKHPSSLYCLRQC
jgi:hypothetical protein